MNPKIDKVIADISKTKAKIAELQAKLKGLEGEKIRLENDRIVELVRKEKVSDEQLNSLIASLHKKPAEARISANTIMEDNDDNLEN